MNLFKKKTVKKSLLCYEFFLIWQEYEKQASTLKIQQNFWFATDDSLLCINVFSNLNSDNFFTATKKAIPNFFL